MIFRPACQGATSLPLTVVAPTEMGKLLLPPKSKDPVVIFAIVPTFEVVAVMPVVTVNGPVGLRVGAAPPRLLKTREVTVFA